MNLDNKKNFIPLLEVLRKMKSNEIPKIMDYLDDNSVNSICECYYNIIHTNFNISKRKKNKLRNHTKTNCSMHRLKTICNKSSPVFKRRKALKQEGKGLPLILAAAIPLLTSLFTSLNK
jgi:hypothetical protein